MPGHPGRAASGSAGPAGVGLGAGVGGGLGLGTGPGVTAIVGEGLAEGAVLAGGTVISGLATATTDPVGAWGSWSPPRAATKVIAIPAQAATNSADARTAGVRVRRAGSGTWPSTSLLFVGWPRTLVPFCGGGGAWSDARLRPILVGAQPMSDSRSIERPAQAMALPLSVETVMLPDPSHLAPHRIKRCTFRRLIRVEPKGDRRYDVECLYPERRLAIPLGDLETATPICNACTAAHIFRPDED